MIAHKKMGLASADVLLLLLLCRAVGPTSECFVLTRAQHLWLIYALVANIVTTISSISSLCMAVGSCFELAAYEAHGSSVRLIHEVWRLLYGCQTLDGVCRRWYHQWMCS